MTPEQIALAEWNNSSERGLRGELGLWEYYPSEIISKDILINMLQYIYFGGGRECLKLRN
jgi:hypothetical protein